MRKFFKDFKDFAMKGNVIDLAVGVMIGGAFQKIVTSLVNDLFMPALSLITGRINIAGAFFAMDGQAYPTLEDAQQAGVSTVNYGLFLSTILDFLLTALCIFLFVRLIMKLRPAKPEAPKAPPRLCPFCREEIHEGATRCPHCTAVLDPKAAPADRAIG